MKITIMRGLPGSGKSTYAKALLAQFPDAYKRINRDELRLMLDNGIKNNGNEKFVKKMRDVLLMEALRAGKNVLIDDTNLSDKNLVRIKQLAQQFEKESGKKVEIQVRNHDTPLETCIERDQKREKPVGEQVIRQMYRQFYVGDDRYLPQDEKLPKALLCDLDGTLALMQNRNPFDASTCENDVLNPPIANLLKNYHQLGFSILLLSGREDSYEIQTRNWLAKYEIPFQHLWMRKAKDPRKDSMVKKEFYETHIKPNYFVEFVLDDRNQVVDLWRDELRLPCLQVYYGNF